jgi:hypothetical protein
MSQIQSTSSASYAIQWQYLQSVQQQSGSDPSSQSGANDPMSFGLDPFSSVNAQPSSGGTSGPPFSLGAMSALIDAQEQSGSSSGLSSQQQKVFGELDTDGDGSVTKAELENDFGTSNKDLADAVFAKLDTNGDGSISQSEFGAGTTKTAHSGHHHHHMAPPPSDSADGASGADGAEDPLSQLLSSNGSANGASSQSVSNSDGSTTTTITYADGSKVSMTSAASSSNSDSGNSSTGGSTTQQTQANLLEQLIKLQAQLTQSITGSSTSAVATV